MYPLRDGTFQSTKFHLITFLRIMASTPSGRYFSSASFIPPYCVRNSSVSQASISQVIARDLRVGWLNKAAYLLRCSHKLLDIVMS